VSEKFPVSPPLTPRTSYYDATTGALLGHFDGSGLNAGYPTVVSTWSCCAGTEMNVDIQRLSSGLVQIQATGEPGWNYELQKSPNLTAWDKLLDIEMTESPALFTDPETPNNPVRYYRLKLIP